MTKSSISDENGWEILKAFTTEQPQPSHRVLATRFKVSRTAIQRYLAKHLPTAQLTEQPSKEAVRAELMVQELPKALAEVEAISKTLTLSKMAKVLSECEIQYNSLKNTDPGIAGGYLTQMRQTLVEMAKWLHLEDQLDIVQVDRVRDERCDHCPFDEGKTIWDQIKEAEAYFQTIEDARVCPHCGKSDKEPPISR